MRRGPARADYVHVDVMDGHFVPNISIGQPIVRAVRSATDKVVDVHLMIDRPERYVESFAEAGADIITVHVEATPHLHRTLQAIKTCGKKAGVSFNPSTPLDSLQWVLDDVDLVLIMSVNPGFGGQTFIPTVLERLRRVRALVERTKRPIDVEVDGGVSLDNAKAIGAAGADVLVAGTAIFAADDYRACIDALRSLASGGS